MTLFDDNPTILEESQLCMHMDHAENMLCDSYIVEFEYDSTCNYYERGKYCGRNFLVTKLPLVMLRLTMFNSPPLHMLVFACLDNLFPYKMSMHRKDVRLKFMFHMFYDALFVFQLLSFMVRHRNLNAKLKGFNEKRSLGGNRMNKICFSPFLFVLECFHNYVTIIIVFLCFN